MALRKSASSIALISNIFRRYSTAGPLINVSVNEKSGVATATLQRPPVNSLNLELLAELSNTLTELEKNKCRGLILTSSSNSVFSAGLDLLEMYRPDMNRVTQFWHTLQQAWMKLYGSSFPTAAAINGHAPAGGCLLSMACEYRVMLDNFTIGLNEVQFGLVAPKWFMSSMTYIIGQREAERALTKGRLFKTDEALKVGLIDEVAASKEEAIEKANKFIQSFSKVSPYGRAITKKWLREGIIQGLANNLEEDTKIFLASVTDEKTQKALDIYIQSLKQKQKQ